jgi:hypothetical protein
MLAVCASLLLILPGGAAPASKHYALESGEGLKLQNVTVEPATLQGKKGIKVQASKTDVAQGACLAVIGGLTFGNGTIEAEIAGEPAPGAGAGARGFVGIAFRVQDDLRTYDNFYLRPTNGRADDQERRNHAVQYESLPDWPWSRLRKETASKYESYVDLIPGMWTTVKIDVRGDHARLYVHNQEQPVLIVNDVKSGPNAKGAIALWIEGGTIAHFRNLTVTGE